MSPDALAPPSERDYAACGDAFPAPSANHWLEDSEYEAQRLRLEIAHSAAEAALLEAAGQAGRAALLRPGSAEPRSYAERFLMYRQWLRGVTYIRHR
jgi:hypothetical protein